MTPLRVLVVEDSEDDALRLVSELRRSGRDVVFDRVETAGQMKAALARESWDLVVSEDSLPDFSASKALALIKETGLDVPFVVVSGNAEEEAAVETMRAGAQDVFLKGCLARLVPAVERELERATQRKASRKAEAAHARLVAIVESSNDAIIGRTLDGTVTAWNAGAERLYGYSAEETIGRPLTLHVPADRAGEMGRILARIRRGEVVDRFETVRIRKDGTRIDVSLTVAPIRSGSGEVIGASTIARDITLQKQAAESIQKLARAVEQAKSAIFMTDPDGSITYANPAFEETYAYSMRQALGKTPRILKSGRHDEAFYESFWRRLLAGESVREEFVNRTRDGRLVTVDASVSPVLDAQGRRTGFIAVHEDITARRQLEDQLRQAQKMEAVGQLAGGVAHDFNNLLTAILGYAELLASKLPADSGLQGEIGEIREAGQRAASLTRQLLAFSRKQVLAPVVLRLNDLVENVEKMLRRVIGEDVQLVTRLDPAGGNVRADPGQLEQVIVNLAVNARDAMPNGGTLTIETAGVELDGSYAERHAMVPPGRYTMLAVGDTGVGMDVATRERIFEPFFTTKEKGKGTGLGLSTVYGIVKQSAGYIWVYSEPSVGTTFKVYLPRVEEAASAIPVRSMESPVAPGTETILLVEDEPAIRALSRRVLETSGYRVLDSGRGTDALERARAEKEPIDLLLTDLVMPNMGGAELASRLQELHPEIRVLFMSGYTDDAVVRSGLLGTGRAFLQKPFTPQNLARKVRELLDASG
jgi:PAS domain S-box-containing protein